MGILDTFLTLFILTVFVVGVGSLILILKDEKGE
jgi:hypothetical protein